MSRYLPNRTQKEYVDLSKYDTTVVRKINAAKSNRLEYRIIVIGSDDKNVIPNNQRITIVVDENGRYISSYYG